MTTRDYAVLAGRFARASLDSLSLESGGNQVKVCRAGNDLAISHLPFAMGYRRSAMRPEAACQVTHVTV